MTDLINRETAYKTLSEYYHHRTDAQQQSLREALDRVPADQQAQELLQENERLRRELARAKRIQFMLFRKVPAEEIMALIYETSEELK